MMQLWFDLIFISFISFFPLQTNPTALQIQKKEDKKKIEIKNSYGIHCKYHFINHNFTSEMHSRRKEINCAKNYKSILMENPIPRKQN